MTPLLDFTPPPSEDYVTTDQAAERLHVRPGTVRQWAYAHGLTPVGRHAGRPLYRLSDVLDVWAATRRTA